MLPHKNASLSAKIKYFFILFFANILFLIILLNLRIKQAGAELYQAQLKLELELSFTWLEFCCIKLTDKNATGYFDCHY